MINEECFQFVECEALKPFKDLNKPIIVRQYGITAGAATYKAAKYNGTSSTRNQIANQLHLNVSVSRSGCLARTSSIDVVRRYPNAYGGVPAATSRSYFSRRMRTCSGRSCSVTCAAYRRRFSARSPLTTAAF